MKNENKPKHTPGKTFELRIKLDVCKSWIDDGFDAHSAIEKIQTFFQEDLIPYAYDGEVTAMVTVKEKKTKANAALIAAAPELLEALKKLEARVDWFFSEDFGRALGINYNPLSEEFFELEQARAAIAKAEGK